MTISKRIFNNTSKYFFIDRAQGGRALRVRSLKTHELHKKREEAINYTWTGI